MSYKELAAQRVAELSTKATPGQVAFIETLLIDCGMSGIKIRNDYLTRECSRRVVYIDVLTMDEAHDIIDKLVMQRKRTRAGEKESTDDGDAGWNRRNDSR